MAIGSAREIGRGDSWSVLPMNGRRHAAAAIPVVRPRPELQAKSNWVSARVIAPTCRGCSDVQLMWFARSGPAFAGQDCERPTPTENHGTD